MTSYRKSIILCLALCASTQTKASLYSDSQYVLSHPRLLNSLSDGYCTEHSKTPFHSELKQLIRKYIMPRYNEIKFIFQAQLKGKCYLPPCSMQYVTSFTLRKPYMAILMQKLGDPDLPEVYFEVVEKYKSVIKIVDISEAKMSKDIIVPMGGKKPTAIAATPISTHECKLLIECRDKSQLSFRVSLCKGKLVFDKKQLLKRSQGVWKRIDFINYIHFSPNPKQFILAYVDPRLGICEDRRAIEDAKLKKLTSLNKGLKRGLDSSTQQRIRNKIDHLEKADKMIKKRKGYFIKCTEEGQQINQKSIELHPTEKARSGLPIFVDESTYVATMYCNDNELYLFSKGASKAKSFLRKIPFEITYEDNQQAFYNTLQKVGDHLILSLPFCEIHSINTTSCTRKKIVDAFNIHYVFPNASCLKTAPVNDHQIVALTKVNNDRKSSKKSAKMHAKLLNINVDKNSIEPIYTLESESDFSDTHHIVYLGCDLLFIQFTSQLFGICQLLQ